MVEIPCRPDLTHYQMQVVLDGVTFTLEFRWNTRESAWYMDVKTEDETPILSSIKIVVRFPLGFRIHGTARPLGLFFAYDTTNKDRDPGIADLGDRVSLIYIPVAEVAALE